MCSTTRKIPKATIGAKETQGETYYPEDSEDDKGYIYLGDAEPSEVYEEEDLLEALASYQEVRQRIKDQRLGRKYFKSPGAGKGHFPKGRPRQKAKAKGPLVTGALVLAVAPASGTKAAGERSTWKS